MTFGVSEARRQKFINQLTQEAIQAYQQKASLIAKEFQTSQYSIIETRINRPQFPTTYSNNVYQSHVDPCSCCVARSKQANSNY